MPVLAAFGVIDWGVLLAYMALVASIGTIVSRRRDDAEGYFLAGRSMPAWAVALSIIATSLSVATFIGVPQEAFTGDLTYLSQSIGTFLAVIVVATVFVPRLYRAGTITIYGYIQQRYGQPASIAMSVMFLLGRLLASGARLFMAAIPVSLLLWGFDARSADLAGIPRWQLVASIVLIGGIGVAYTLAGGVRAVIWTDTAQITIVAGAAAVSIYMLLDRIPVSAGEICSALSAAGPHGASKLRILDTSFSATGKFTLWTALIGATFLNTAAYGTDHDLAQRMLTARSPLRGSLSLIASQIIGTLVVAMFLVLGLLLYVFYQRPDIMGQAAPSDRVVWSYGVYPQFLLNHMPAGLAGLAMAGMFAAAQGSLDSAINAMAGSAVADIYWPLRRRRGLPPDSSTRAPRIAVILMGAALIIFAVGAALVYDARMQTLIAFALGIMSFAYSGMLGVFLAALLTHRGSTRSVMAALFVGMFVTALLQDGIMRIWTLHLTGRPHTLAFYWWLPIGTACSFVVCIAGRSPRAGAVHNAPAPAGTDSR